MVQRSENTRAAFFMMISTVAYTLNDTCIKLIGPEMPLFQLLFLRGAVSTVFILIVAVWLGPIKFRFPLRDWGFIGLRTFAELASSLLIITALMHMPIANLTAILQMLPLTVTLGGALIFREAVGWRRMIAILVGFTGMLLIARPGPDGFNTYALYAIAAVGFVTVRDLITRPISTAVPSITVTLAAAIGVTLIAGIGATQETWIAISPREVTLIVGSAAAIIVAYLFSTMVMRIGNIAAVSPFRYTSLIWALVIGLVVFGDWPDALTLLGAAIVVATGIFTILRERHAARKASRKVSHTV